MREQVVAAPVTVTCRLVRCLRCGHTYVNPQPEPLGLWYPETYYAFQELTTTTAGTSRGLYGLRAQVIRAAVFASSPGHWRQQPRAWRYRMRPLVALTKYHRWGIPTYRSGGQVLDVGCGDGAFLQPLQDIGWAATGLELQPTAVQRARAAGLEVYAWDPATPETATPFDGRQFDAVRFWHTLEHLRDPRQALRRAHQWLRPGGELVIGVPNIWSLNRFLFGRHWAGWELPQHLHHFTRRTLERVVTETGFRVQVHRCVSIGTALLTVTRALGPLGGRWAANDVVRGVGMLYDHLLDLLGLGDSVELRAVKVI